jgi:hypothetical protein
LWTNKNWTLWMGRPPPKWKKKLYTEQEPVIWRHWPLGMV